MTQVERGQVMHRRAPTPQAPRPLSSCAREQDNDEMEHEKKTRPLTSNVLIKKNQTTRLIIKGDQTISKPPKP